MKAAVVASFDSAPRYQDFGVRNAYDLARLLGEGVQANAPAPSFAAS